MCKCANVQMCKCANVQMCQCANVLMCKLFHWHLLAHFHIVYSHIIYYRIFNVIIVIAANTMVTIQKRTVIFDSWNTL